jgi:high-affinity Fe2+/Pb2+ permease
MGSVLRADVHLRGSLGMPKALCLAGMVVAILIAILFAVDLAASIPFRRASVVMDVSLIVAALLLGLASWMTFREQR